LLNLFNPLQLTGGTRCLAVAPSEELGEVVVAQASPSSALPGANDVELVSFTADGRSRRRAFHNSSTVQLRASSLQLVGDGECVTAAAATATSDAIVVLPLTEHSRQCGASISPIPSSSLTVSGEALRVSSLASVESTSYPRAAGVGLGGLGSTAVPLSPFLAVTLDSGATAWLSLSIGGAVVRRASKSAVSGAAGAAFIDGAFVLVTSEAESSFPFRASFSAIDASGAPSAFERSILASIAAAYDATLHGAPRSLYAIPFAKADGSGYGLRLIVVGDDGFTAMFQGGSLMWTSDEGAACIVQAEGVEVAPEAGRASLLVKIAANTVTGDGEGDHEAPSAEISYSDGTLSFVSRLQSQCNVVLAAFSHAAYRIQVLYSGMATNL
jgi:hypothetical protein